MVSAGAIDGPAGKRILRYIWERSEGDRYDLPPSVEEGCRAPSDVTLRNYFAVANVRGGW